MSSGTAAFTSPELGCGELDVGAPTDVWSLGVTLYEMAMSLGHHYRAERFWRKLHLPFLDRSDRLKELWDRMLMYNSIKRITAGEIVTMLEPIMSARAGPPSSVAPPPAPARRKVSFLLQPPGEREPSKVIMPEDATVRDLIVKANELGIPGDRVKAQGYIVGENDELSDFEGAVFTVAGERSLVPGTVPAKLVDIAFVIDGTGSMENVINAVRDYVASIAIGLRMCDRRARIQYACVVYRDPVDSPSDVHEHQDFKRDPLQVREFLNGVSARGGGDNEEDFVGAATIVRNLSWRPEARKSVFWIADSAAHGKFYGTRPNHQDQEPLLAPLISDLAQREIRFIAMAIGNSAVRTFRRFSDIYEEANQGSRFRLVDDWNPVGAAIPTDVDGIGKTIATTVLDVAADMLRDPLK
jgi:hypothetical protein